MSRDKYYVISFVGEDLLDKLLKEEISVLNTMEEEGLKIGDNYLTSYMNNLQQRIYILEYFPTVKSPLLDLGGNIDKVFSWFVKKGYIKEVSI